MTETALAADYVLARNNMAGPTVLASDPRSTFEVRWMGAGDPDGGDIQPVPPEIARTVQFASAVRKGIIAILGQDAQDDAEEALGRQRAAFESRMAEGTRTAAESLERVTDTDLVALPCVGPGSRSGQPCPDQVMVRSGERDAAPPLCGRHASLAPRYERAEGPDGKPSWRPRKAGGQK